MKRIRVMALLFGLALAVPAMHAQESRTPEESGETAKGEDKLAIWKWVNFVLLAGGLGYLAGKNGGPFFASRARQIRKGIVEAGDQRKEAEERLAAVERRLAGLEGEIATLREESRIEAEAETAQLTTRTAAEAAKIGEHAEQEIAAAAKSARSELKSYAAQLAVELAEGKIRSRMTSAAHDALVDGFVGDLKPHSSAQTT